MRKSADYLVSLKPWSLAAFAVALAVLAIAAVAQGLAASLGATPHFATLLPAILVASLVAGAPAGIATSGLAVLVEWWAFMPPQFELGPLTAADYDKFLTFLLPALLAVWLAQICRQAFALQQE
jgi:K+-sensing histidine kinase KdpD